MTRAQCIPIKVAIIFCLASVVASCSGVDDEFFPYRMKGLNAWVYDLATDESFLAGYTEAGYTSRREGLASCAAMAASAAAARNLSEWSHICCTVTSKSQCATKVR